MDGGAWGATVHGVTKSQTRLSDFTHSLDVAGTTVLFKVKIRFKMFSLFLVFFCISCMKSIINMLQYNTR